MLRLDTLAQDVVTYSNRGGKVDMKIASSLHWFEKDGEQRRTGTTTEASSVTNSQLEQRPYN